MRVKAIGRPNMPLENVIGVNPQNVKRNALLGVCVLFGGAAALSIYGALEMETSSSPTFYLLNASLSIYIFAECFRHIKRSDDLGLLAPPFLASMLHFFLAYIIGPVASLFDPWILNRFAHFFSSQAAQLTETTLFVGLAVFSMWRGYEIGLPLAATLRQRLAQSSLFRQDIEPALMPVLSLQVVYFTIVSYAISSGIFGMMSTAEQREQNVTILDLLNLGITAGSLSLFLLFTYVYKRRAAGHSDKHLVLIASIFFAMHVLVGSMSGFKSQIVMPFAMLVFAKFVATKKISLLLIAGPFIALFVAYQVIEPFRAYIFQQGLQGSSSVGGVLEAMQRSQEERETLISSDQAWGTQVASRFDLLGMTSVGIAAARSNPAVKEKGNEFSESLYLSPLLAFVPRALWPQKPSYSSGVWFANEVFGNSNRGTTSIGMGPVAWLYITGGWLGIVIGFLCIGLLQAVLFQGVARSGFGGFIVFLAAMLPLIGIPTDVGPALTGLMKLIPIAILAQYFLLKPASYKRKRI